MNNKEVWNYDTLTEWSAGYYSGLLTAAHQVGDRKSINLGTKDDPDEHIFYLYKMENIIYALPEENAKDLPILITGKRTKKHYRDVIDIVTNYKSARFKPEKKLEFRQLVDDLCCFEHSSPIDFTVWKIISFAALIGRISARVCSQPGTGKDSVMKVLGFLMSNVCVISNPTVAKLEYRLTGNKVLMLNEFANLKADDRYGMEHFLQSVGDMSPIYEKRSRAGMGTMETFDISNLSVLCAYNDLSCYVGEEKYFDNVFSQQTKDRFIPFKFEGKISQQIEPVKEPQKVADENSEYLQHFIRTITYYSQAWRDELSGKREWNVKKAEDYSFKGRWANNFDRIREFVLLYANNEEEAQYILNVLYNRHVGYLEQFGMNRTLDGDWKPRVQEELIVREDDVEVNL